MYRSDIKNLIDWKLNNNKKPLSKTRPKSRTRFYIPILRKKPTANGLKTKIFTNS
jgi:hypothetical protein